MERLDFSEETSYSAVEACIHLNRYALARQFINNGRVLDAACGEGYGSYLLKKWGAASVDGIDIDEKTIKRAKALFKLENVNFLCSDVEELPFEDHYFDVIVSFETIEHLSNPEKFLKEIHRVLKPGGVIIVSCPNDPYYYPDEKDSNPFHKRKYTYFDFRELAEKYLGNTVEYFLAFAVNGFLNMPISYSTEPSDALQPDMTEMLNYVQYDNALCVKQERYLNHWNSNYYVGIWGGNGISKSVNSVIFPRETFIEVKDEDIQLRKAITNWQANKEKDFLNYRQDLEREILKNERFSMMQELLNREIICLRGSCDKIYDDYQKSKNELEGLQKSLDDCRNELAQKQGYEVELSIIKKSKGWKLLTFLYKLEGIFCFWKRERHEQ